MEKRRRKYASAGVLLALLLTVGCAGTQVARPGAAPQAIFTYEPESMRESWAQFKLERADGKVRPKLERAREVADVATGKYLAAAKALDAEELPPNVVRPTREEVDALRETARAKWKDYERLLTGQMDRYKEFLSQDPQNWYARHRYAWFLSDHGLRFEAAEEWRSVIEREPTFPYAYNNLGSLYNHMGRDMEAVDLFHKAIALYDNDPVFHLNLAVNYSVHRSDVAEKFGWDLPRVFRECMAEYRKALELAPKDVDIARDIASQHILAKFFGVTDTVDQSIEDWKYYLSLDLTDNQRGIGCRNLGRIYMSQKKDPVAAREWLEKAYQLLGDSTTEMLLERAKEAAAQPGVSTAD